MSTIKKRAYFTATSLVLIDVHVRVSINIIKAVTQGVSTYQKIIILALKKKFLKTTYVQFIVVSRFF